MNRHTQAIQDLEERLESKPYGGSIANRVNYSLGECDVLRMYKGREVYYEIKTKDTKRGYKKARAQLRRWTKHMAMYPMHNYKVDFYGIYYVPGVTVKLVCKNGRFRR